MVLQGGADEKKVEVAAVFHTYYPPDTEMTKIPTKPINQPGLNPPGHVELKVNKVKADRLNLTSKDRYTPDTVEWVKHQIERQRKGTASTGH